MFVRNTVLLWYYNHKIKIKKLKEIERTRERSHKIRGKLLSTKSNNNYRNNVPVLYNNDFIHLDIK